MNLQERIVKEAKGWIGEEFNPGVSAQCAAWVSTVLDAAGVKDQGYQHSAWVPDYEKMGKRVPLDEKKIPGDIVIFDNTYMEAESTHIGIYVGDNEFVHRGTSEAPVKKELLDSPYWSSRLAKVRRFTDNQPKSTEYKTVKLFVNKNGKNLILDGKELEIVSLEIIAKVKP